MKTLSKLSLLFLATQLMSCAMISFVGQFDCRNVYVDSRYETANFTNYVIGDIHKTPGGVQLDSSGVAVDPARIDSLTNEVEACLGKPIQRCGFRVKLAPDWRPATLPVQTSPQVFPCNLGAADQQTNPGLCTGIVQYPSTAVVTPDLAAYKHEIIHIVTHKGHEDPVFAKCQ